MFEFFHSAIYSFSWQAWFFVILTCLVLISEAGHELSGGDGDEL